MGTPFHGDSLFTDIPFHRDLFKETEPFTEIPQKEHGTRQPNRKWHDTEDPPVDRKTLVKTVSSYTLFAGGTVIKMLALVYSVNLRYVTKRRTLTSCKERRFSLLSIKQHWLAFEASPDSSSFKTISNSIWGYNFVHSKVVEERDRFYKK